MLKLAEFFEVAEGVKFEVVGLIEQQYKIVNNELLYHDIDRDMYIPSNNDLNWFTRHEIKIIQPKKTISEDEKVILRNLPSEFTWIARDENDSLYIYGNKPERGRFNSYYSTDLTFEFETFKHLFQCIKWEDAEPTLIADLLKEV